MAVAHIGADRFSLETGRRRRAEREERAEGLDSSQRGRRLSEQESWRKLDTVGSIASIAADQQCHEK